MGSTASRPRRPTPVQKDSRARWDWTYAGPWAKYTYNTYGYVITAFYYSCHPLDVDTILTQLEQYANYEHSTNNLTRLVQLQRYRSGIQAIFGLILAKSVAGLKVFRGILQSLQANAVEVISQDFP